MRVEATRASAVERELGSARVIARRADGAIDVEVPCANRPAFRSWVLGLVEHAEVLEPADVREDVVAWLRRIRGRGSV